MKRRFSLFVWVLFLLGSLASCKGTSPAGPPAPPAEVPGFVIFPDSLEVSRGSLSTSGFSLQASELNRPPFKSMDSAFLTSLINTGESLQQAVVEFAAAKEVGDADCDGITDETVGVLGAYSRLKIPTHPELKYCVFDSSGGTCYDSNGGTSFTNVDGESVSPSGTTTNTVLISFANADLFDSDDVGSTVACTGNSCPVDCSDPDNDCSEGCPTAVTSYAPICIRIWTNDISETTFDDACNVVTLTPREEILPVLAMRMDRLPCYVDSGSTDCLAASADTTGKDINPGQGFYKAKIITADKDITSTVADGIDVGSETVEVDQVQIAEVTYDHRAEDGSKLTDVTLKTEQNLNNITGIDTDMSDVLTTSFIRGLVYQDAVPSSTSGATRVLVTADYLFYDRSDLYDLITGETDDIFGGFNWLTYISRLLSDRTLWSGNIAMLGLPASVTCAENVGTGGTDTWQETTQAECESAEIDVSDLLDSDYQVPDDDDTRTTIPETVNFPEDTVDGMPEDYCLAHDFTGCP